MALPTRNLDDRSFQQIVDEARKRIKASCPNWTDHNISDPGITLVELFAWMTEMILYRLNQVPEKNYIKFMELLGLKLCEPDAARTVVTFYLSSPQSISKLIEKGTEVATVRTETQPAIVFSTETPLEIHPPVLTALITREVPKNDGAKAVYTEHNLKHLGVTGHYIDAFASASIGSALYLGFENDLSQHVLGLEMTCEHAKGLGIDAANPPWQWEVWRGGEGQDRWSPAIVEKDETGGMNRSGIILLRLPTMTQRDFQNHRAYWLRCRVVEPQVKGRNYEKSPRINHVVAGSWGASVKAAHTSVVRNEGLGCSDGSPGQVFFIERKPLLWLDQDKTCHLELQVQAPGSEEWESWQEVPDFGDSGFSDKHFTCDSATGEIRFGPALRQPDGSVWSYSAIPPRGAQIRAASYCHGGGSGGNVQAGMLNVLKTSIPYVDHVVNHAPAMGGIDAESIELAKLRTPQLLRLRERNEGRAVTAGDYEALAQRADSRVQRARCVQPPPLREGDGQAAGTVFVLLVPTVNDPAGHIAPNELRLEDDLREKVQHYLNAYRLLTIRLDIREPEYLWVEVELSCAAYPGVEQERVRTEIEKRIYRYLNPIVGGPIGDGWPFGRALYPADVYTCLQNVAGIDYIESLRVSRVSPSGTRTEITDHLTVPLHGLIASAEHRIHVK